MISFDLWIIFTSRVYGIKFQFKLYILTVFIPWLRNLKLWNGRLVALYFTLLSLFFLPFVQFKAPFGLARTDIYIDIILFLKNIYVPAAWKIGATEQRTVETNMCLNFMFFCGLLLVALSF